MARATLQLACQYLSAISRVLQADQAQEHSFWLLSPPSGSEIKHMTKETNHNGTTALCSLRCRSATLTPLWCLLWNRHRSSITEQHSVSVLADHSSWSASPGLIALWLWHSGVEALGIQSPWISFCFSGKLGCEVLKWTANAWWVSFAVGLITHCNMEKHSGQTPK